MGREWLTERPRSLLWDPWPPLHRSGLGWRTQRQRAGNRTWAFQVPPTTTDAADRNYPIRTRRTSTAPTLSRRFLRHREVHVPGLISIPCPWGLAREQSLPTSAAFPSLFAIPEPATVPGFPHKAAGSCNTQQEIPAVVFQSASTCGLLSGYIFLLFPFQHDLRLWGK